MNKGKPDKKMVKDLLRNWRHWARDCPPDSAEIHYYTIGPMFKQFVKPTPTWIRHDEESALMVEDVLREMYKAHRRDRELIRLYWLYINNVRDLADALDMPKSTLYDRLSYAEMTFAETWALLFYRN